MFYLLLYCKLSRKYAIFVFTVTEKLLNLHKLLCNDNIHSKITTAYDNKNSQFQSIDYHVSLLGVCLGCRRL